MRDMFIKNDYVMKKIGIIVLVLLLSCGAKAQLRYQSVLEAMDHDSPAFRSMQARKAAGQAAAQAEPYLPNPEVEFGFYWGSPSDIGKRWDLKLMQSFEFPSVYVHKSRIAKLLEQSAELDCVQRRRALTIEVQQVCSDIVYYNACVAFYTRCAEVAGQVAESYRMKMEAGECNVLEYNRAQMHLAGIRNKLDMAAANLDMMLDNLQMLNGGKRLELSQSQFDGVSLPANFEQWFSSVAEQNPSLMLLQQQQQLGEERSKLAKSEWAPTFAAGYASENVVGETFRGLSVQMSLPLWQKRGTLKKARMEMAAAQADYETEYARCYSQMQGLYRKAASLRNNVDNLRMTFSSYNSEALLLKALEAGEISLESYLQQVEFYNDAEMEVIDLQHELDYTVLQLESYSLQ